MTRTNPTPETRRKVLLRDGYRCVRCGAVLGQRWDGFSIHHRHLRSHPFDRLHEASNLICLCGNGDSDGCHGWCHQHPREAMEHGWIVSGFNDHPEDVPVEVYKPLLGRHIEMLLDDDGNRRENE